MPLRVVVTGGAGFIGSHLVERLLNEGHRVWVADDLSRGSPDRVKGHPEVHLEVVDVASPAFTRWLAEVRPDRVFHLAANADVHAGAEDPGLDRHRTLLTTLNLLEAMAACGCRELVFTSSSTVYGEPHAHRDDDHGPQQPISRYGAAKVAAEAYISASAHLQGLRAWTLRLPNVIGGRLTHGVVHDFLDRLGYSPRRLDVRGDGSQRKSFLHVEDLLRAFDLVLAGPPGTWDITGDGATSVAEIAALVLDALGLSTATVAFEASDRGWPGDVRHQDISAARIAALGFAPRLSSSGAVERAIAEELEWRAGRSPRALGALARPPKGSPAV